MVGVEPPHLADVLRCLAVALLGLCWRISHLLPGAEASSKSSGAHWTDLRSDAPSMLLSCLSSFPATCHSDRFPFKRELDLSCALQVPRGSLNRGHGFLGFLGRSKSHGPMPEAAGPRILPAGRFAATLPEAVRAQRGRGRNSDAHGTGRMFLGRWVATMAFSATWGCLKTGEPPKWVVSFWFLLKTTATRVPRSKDIPTT